MVKEVSTDELHSIINNELSRLQECPGCRIKEVLPRQEGDSIDSDWERGETLCADHMSENCEHIVNHVTQWAKENFTLKY